jgi:cytochrome b subunit of formate dehydrogenase
MHGEQGPRSPEQAQVAATARPAHLHPMWRYGLAIAWAAALVGLLVPENQGYDLGKKPFWWNAVILVVAAVIAVVGLVLRDWRWAPLCSIGLSLVLVVLALPDLAENTGIAVKQLAIAAGILLVSVGSLSAWSPRSD